MKNKIINIIISILSKINGGYENLLILIFKRIYNQTNGEDAIFGGLDLISFDSNKSIVSAFKIDRFEPYNILQSNLFGAYLEPDSENHNNFVCRIRDIRGIIPLDNIKSDKQLLKHLADFEIKIDYNFHETVMSCAKPRKYIDNTWITNELMNSLFVLHDMGFAHSIEAYQDNVLVGGLFGIIINGCYIGYSQFTDVSYSSKAAMYNLILKLKNEGFKLYDVIGTSDWLKQFGMNVLSGQEFKCRLIDALLQPVHFSGKI